ncbi:MAG TPA: hypothetical protein DCP90_05540 [Clostridiales bacterium]|nr:MAG: hypothetical protein A2Y22_05675 [Clostridiales bacterium GWD2_32_59]HAN10064.1 hypothetical protein [Clostridiales bacterium]
MFGFLFFEENDFNVKIFSKNVDFDGKIGYIKLYVFKKLIEMGDIDRCFHKLIYMVILQLTF